MKSVLTIAGSDSSGGAGIQADLKTMSALGVFGQSAITALTAQNTLGVSSVYAVEPEFLKAQINSVFQDIYPEAVKIGMISSPELVEAIAEELVSYKAAHIVLDPVMVATSGASLSSSSSVKALVAQLFPLAEIVTPNIPEAEVLLSLAEGGVEEVKISSKEDMEKATQIIQGFGCKNVLIKGGHAVEDANDYLLCESGEGYWLSAERVETENTHGTGCTLSSAIASYLAQGSTVLQAVKEAKGYLTAALKADLQLGKGNGPLNHIWLLGLTKNEIIETINALVTVEKAS